MNFLCSVSSGARFTPPRWAVRRTGLLIVTVASLLPAGPVRADTWGITADFDTSNNPSRNNGGVWSYGVSITVGGTMYLYKVHGFYGYDLTQLAYWTSATQAGAIEYNTSGQTIGGGSDHWPPHGLSMHVGQNGAIPVIRFTAPKAGTYTISGSFGPGDTKANLTAYVVRSGTVVFTGSYTGGATVPFTETLQNVSSGETIDFEAAGEYAFGDVGLEATISLAGATGPLTQADAANALNVSSGLLNATGDDMARLDVVPTDTTSPQITILDAVRIARKAAGLDQ